MDGNQFQTKGKSRSSQSAASLLIIIHRASLACRYITRSSHGKVKAWKTL